MQQDKRSVFLKFVVTPEERDTIMEKMAQCGCTNLSAYLRKMALDGYIINLDLPELREISSLLRRSSNNINQIAKRANETRRLYDTDVGEIQRSQQLLLERFSKVLSTLSALE